MKLLQYLMLTWTHVINLTPGTLRTRLLTTLPVGNQPIRTLLPLPETAHGTTRRPLNSKHVLFSGILPFIEEAATKLT